MGWYFICEWVLYFGGGVALCKQWKIDFIFSTWNLQWKMGNLLKDLKDRERCGHGFKMFEIQHRRQPQPRLVSRRARVEQNEKLHLIFVPYWTKLSRKGFRSPSALEGIRRNTVKGLRCLVSQVWQRWTYLSVFWCGSQWSHKITVTISDAPGKGNGLGGHWNMCKNCGIYVDMCI